MTNASGMWRMSKAAEALGVVFTNPTFTVGK